MKTLVSILGADIWNDNGVWRTNGLNGPGDHSGVTLDRFRVVAGAYLFEQSPDGTAFIVQGGLAQENKPSIAAVMKKELLELGVPEAAVLLEEKSHSSHTQLLELQTLAVREQPEHINIVSNEWHLPRLRAMLECLPELSKLCKMAPTFVEAEDVLVRQRPHEWSDSINKIRGRADVLKRIEKEELGAAQIRNGTYTFR